MAGPIHFAIGDLPGPTPRSVRSILWRRIDQRLVERPTLPVVAGLHEMNRSWELTTAIKANLLGTTWDGSRVYPERPSDLVTRNELVR
jgi:hypothetical protein